jgi:hypothetical protein
VACQRRAQSHAATVPPSTGSKPLASRSQKVQIVVLVSYMRLRVRPVVTFRSAAFNVTEKHTYFINDCCFGDDVAKWLIGELRKEALQTDDEPGQYGYP